MLLGLIQMLPLALILFLPPHLDARDPVVQEKAAGIAGLYLVSGNNPDGSRYEGVARIKKTTNGYSMKWRISGGGEYQGTGSLDGRVLTIDWGSDSPVEYIVQPDGSLYGIWAKGQGLERLTQADNF